MTNAGCCARLAQKTKARQLVTEIAFANNLQGHRATQINVERLVGDAHSAATQLDRSAIIVQHQFIILESANLLSAVCRPRNWTLFLVRSRFSADSCAQDTNGTESPEGFGEELRAASRAYAYFLLH